MRKVLFEKSKIDVGVGVKVRVKVRFQASMHLVEHGPSRHVDRVERLRKGRRRGGLLLPCHLPITGPRALRLTQMRRLDYVAKCTQSAGDIGC